jgi:hypothetical protein
LRIPDFTFRDIKNAFPTIPKNEENHGSAKESKRLKDLFDVFEGIWQDGH